MKRSMMTVAALAVTFVASTAQAQVARPITFGVSAGAAIPTGDMGDGLNTGFGIAGIADMKTHLPVNFRGELSFNRFGASDVDGNARILAGIVNAVLPISSAGAIQPYLIGGPGVYNLKLTQSFGGADVSTSKTAMGLNGGLGLNFHLGTFSTFAEARYNYIFSKDDNTGMPNSQTIPLSFGIRF